MIYDPIRNFAGRPSAFIDFLCKLTIWDAATANVALNYRVIHPLMAVVMQL